MSAKRKTIPDRHSVSAQLREIIESRGESIYSIELAAEIPRGSLARFVSGERSLTLATVDRLAKSLGVRLVEVAARPGNRRKGASKHGGSEPSIG